MRIFLDANILFSAAKSAGAIRRLLELLLEARHECWVDGFVIGEARRNLELKAPSGLAALDRLLRSLRVGGVRTPDPGLDAALPPIHLGCNALLTGDRTHFGELYGHSIRGVAIHSPRSLAEALWGPR